MSRLHLGEYERSDGERSESRHSLKRFASVAKSFELVKIDSGARIERCLPASIRSVRSLVEVSLECS